MSDTYTLGLDFETYSATDLKKHGLERYVRDPHFTVLFAGVAAYGIQSKFYDMTQPVQVEQFREVLDNYEGVPIAAHNVGFERRVLQHLGITRTEFVDSAVMARAAGAGSSLNAAVQQMINQKKLAQGERLIKLFSVPGKLQAENGDDAFDPRIIEEHPEDWEEFGKYCALDATLTYLLAQKLPRIDSPDFSLITQEMNEEGWTVDMGLVEEMQRRYLKNRADALQLFQDKHAAHTLNLASPMQLRAWCEERGVSASSFDERAVARMIPQLQKRLSSTTLPDDRRKNYEAVLDMLQTKQLLGGSSLKKLQVIKDTAVLDPGGLYRLRHQYVHAGAGQTLRTSGRSVQMQNLKRFGNEPPANVSTLRNPLAHWNNELLASNLRQVFTASHPAGRLIVGDFSSVESRGLAYLAGEQWKLAAYTGGADLYKELAGKIYNVDPGSVDKGKRTVGKVGELSCGYGAGPGAVKAFASNMGLSLSEGEAKQLVNDWRQACPQTTSLWGQLDWALHDALRPGGRPSIILLRSGMRLVLEPGKSPQSLIEAAPMPVKSVSMRLEVHPYDFKVVRVFHGCYQRGGNIGYWRATDRKTGDLWSPTYTDPKTKQRRHYELYGGKLAGILTQSFCREIFFYVLHGVHHWAKRVPNVRLVGQFHDEIVLDWVPSADPAAVSLEGAEATLHSIMSQPPRALSDFPLEAEIKSDYRYTK